MKIGADDLKLIGTLATGAITFNANAGTTNVGAEQTFAALNIADGAIVVLGAITPPRSPFPSPASARCC